MAMLGQPLLIPEEVTVEAAEEAVKGVNQAQGEYPAEGEATVMVSVMGEAVEMEQEEEGAEEVTIIQVTILTKNGLPFHESKKTVY
jgi:hypothetical protein